MLSLAERQRIDQIPKLTEEHYREIGANLKKARKNAMLTQEDIAECLGVDVRTISRLENDGTCPLDRLLYLCAVYRCGLDDIIPQDFLSFISRENQFISTLDISQLETLSFLIELETVRRKPKKMDNRMAV